MPTNSIDPDPVRPQGGLLRAALQLLVALAAALPLSLWLWPHMPLVRVPAVWGMALDRLVLFLLVLAGVFLLLRKLPLLGYGALAVVAGWDSSIM